MKRMFTVLLTLSLCAAVLCAPAYAEEPAAPAANLGPVMVWGTITHWTDGSLLLENSGEGAPYQEIVLHLGEAPVVDAVTGQPLETEKLKDGDTVYAWIGGAVTLSLPPQASALLVVGNIPADYAVPQYYEITASSIAQEQAVLTVAGGEKPVTVPASAELTPYLTKNMVSLGELVPGTRILVWSDGKGAVTRVLVFAYAYSGYFTCEEDGMVRVNGEALAVKARITDSGETLLPVRAVAEKLGLFVFWEKTSGANVCLPGPDGSLIFAVQPGSGKAEVNKVGNWVELSGGSSLEQGVTYLSAVDMANLLNLYWAK